jgi:dTDP-4-amino-4,6-dideoxygalactose transaminase
MKSETASPVRAFAPEPFATPIYVTRPFLPPLEEFTAGLQEIWDSHWLTNNGPIVKRFHRQLARYFGSENVCLFTNGTLALQIGLQGMGISGEVITTPFTFVATTHALYWNKIRAVFVDIEPDHYTLDPDAVEAAITPWTTAILAVHVFGHPCRLERLSELARRHNLRLIYDAAHSFGVTVGGESIARFGDMTMFSFHATKTYHSIEGGLLTFRDPGLQRILKYLRNFGFQSEDEVVMPGTNAKMNEFQALMGGMVLKYMEENIAKRRQITAVYEAKLKDVPGIHLRPPLGETIGYNYAYVPIRVDKEEFGMDRDQLREKLREYNVHARLYFWPLICDYACYRHVSVNDPLTVARKVASTILVLPIYYDLSLDDAEKICDIIVEVRRKAGRSN